MNAADRELFELMHKALQSSAGIAIATNDPKLALQRLQKLREKYRADFEPLHFAPSPIYPTGEVFIVNVGRKDES